MPTDVEITDVEVSSSQLTVLAPQSLAVSGVTITGPVMHFPDDLPEDQWAAMHKPFSVAEMGTPWWRGDWYNWGEAKYRHFAQILEIPDKRKRTFQNNGSVCRQYTPEEREQTWQRLSFSHHAAVAYVDKELRRRLLSYAIENDWSVSELTTKRDKLTERTQEADAADQGAGVPGNEEYISVELPVTVKSIGALIFDHLDNEDDMIALRAWLTERIGDREEESLRLRPRRVSPPAPEEDNEPWNVHASRLIREAIEEGEAYTELPSTYKLAATRLATWIESQGEQEGNGD